MIEREAWHREADERALSELRKKVDQDAKRGVYDHLPEYWKLWERSHPGVLPPGVPYFWWKQVPQEALTRFPVVIWEQNVQLVRDDPDSYEDPGDPGDLPNESWASETEITQDEIQYLWKRYWISSTSTTGRSSKGAWPSETSTPAGCWSWCTTGPRTSRRTPRGTVRSTR